VQRSLTVALTIVALASAARAQEKPPDGWKWDAKKWSSAQSQDKTLKVGDKHYHEGGETSAQTYVVGGEKTDSSSKLAYRYIEEIVEVDTNNLAKRAKCTVEKWSSTGEDGKEDTSLQGKVVIATRDGDKTNTEIQEAAGVSDAAKSWASTAISLTKAFAGASGKDDKEGNDVFMPKEPVAPDTEWKIDLEAVAKAYDLKIDASKSKGSGKLTNVSMDKGYARGKFVIQITLKMTTMPSSEDKWTEGGELVMSYEYEGSLVDNRHYRTTKFQMSMGGKAEIKGEGDAKQPFEMKMTTTTEEKSGRVEK
jgi:hypothetical protein